MIITIIIALWKCVCVSFVVFFGFLLLFASINTHIIRSSLCIKTKLIAFIFSLGVWYMSYPSHCIVTIFFGVSGSFQICRLQSIDLGHREPKWLCLWFDLERPLLTVTIFFSTFNLVFFFHCFYTKMVPFLFYCELAGKKNSVKNTKKSREKEDVSWTRFIVFLCESKWADYLCGIIFGILRSPQVRPPQI